MLYIGICDDDEGVCAELERMLYDYAEQNKIQMDIDIWHRGESLCRFLREKEQISDVLFLDIELLTTNGIEVGRFITWKLQLFTFQRTAVMRWIYFVYSRQIF